MNDPNNGEQMLQFAEKANEVIDEAIEKAKPAAEAAEAKAAFGFKTIATVLSKVTRLSRRTS